MEIKGVLAILSILVVVFAFSLIVSRFLSPGGQQVSLTSGKLCEECVITHTTSVAAATTTTTATQATTTTTTSASTTTTASTTATTSATTTTTTTVTTTTTTVPPGNLNFTASNFTCSAKAGGYNCSLNYDNELAGNALIVFFVNDPIGNTANIISYSASAGEVRQTSTTTAVTSEITISLGRHTKCPISTYCSNTPSRRQAKRIF